MNVPPSGGVPTMTAQRHGGWIDRSNRPFGPTGNDEQPQQGRPSRPH
jgi:hypothetical protein